MKYIVLILAMLMSGAVFSEQKPLQDIGQLVWKNRIILILSDEDDANYAQIFKKYDDQIKDRHIIWFVLSDSQVVTNYSEKLSSEFSGILESSFSIEDGRVLLIGKDGGVKGRANELDLNAIFREIDSMPMRQQEMRSKG